jgi:penicillin-binding protein 2
MKKPVEIHRFANPRLLHFFLIFGVMFSILLSGLAWRQLFKSEEYLEQEERQSQRRILQPAPRGEIYDRNGELLVGNRPVFTAAIFLGELRTEFKKDYFKRVKTMRDAGLKVNRDKLMDETRLQVIQRHVDLMNNILGRNEKIDPNELTKHFRKRLLLPMTLIKDLKPEEYAQLIEQLPVSSPIQVIVDSARYYPHGSLAAHVLGYIGNTEELSEEGVPGNHLTTFSHKGKTGKMGLELSFNQELQGTSGGEIWLVDPQGFQYQPVEKKIPIKGNSLTTSIDIDIQEAAESALEGRCGAIVAIQVKTGEVLAMASSPTYDQNELTPYIPTTVFNKINERRAWIDRATQGFYPPASPFKIITAICGLKNDIMTPDQIFTCGSSFLVGNKKFPEHENRTFGPIDLKGAIRSSSNVYFYPLALQMGPEKMAQEARNFGLDKPTGIELLTEGKRMLVPDPAWKLKVHHESWRGGDTANMAIGQGFLSTTPLQMACFAAALARKETRIQPSLIHDPSHTGCHPESTPIGITDSDYNALIDGMRLCAEKGTAKHAQVPGLSLAAKTGTGQTWLNKKYVVAPIFFGFAPIEDPQIALVVLIEGDDRSIWGGTTAGPLAQIVLSAYYDKYIKP